MNRKSYPSDLSDAEWQQIEPLLPREKPGGRPRTVNLREILNGIFYVLRSGCQWEMLPHDLPGSDTVYAYFRKWQRNGRWEQIHQQLRHKVRGKVGKAPRPTVASADSQSVKTTEKRGRSMVMTELRRLKDANGTF